MKALEGYVPVLLYKVVLTFESVDAKSESVAIQTRAILSTLVWSRFSRVKKKRFKESLFLNWVFFENEIALSSLNFLRNIPWRTFRAFGLKK